MFKSFNQSNLNLEMIQRTYNISKVSKEVFFKDIDDKSLDVHPFLYAHYDNNISMRDNQSPYIEVCDFLNDYGTSPYGISIDSSYWLVTGKKS